MSEDTDPVRDREAEIRGGEAPDFTAMKPPGGVPDPTATQPPEDEPGRGGS